MGGSRDQEAVEAALLELVDPLPEEELDDPEPEESEEEDEEDEEEPESEPDEPEPEESDPDDELSPPPSEELFPEELLLDEEFRLSLR